MTPLPADLQNLEPARLPSHVAVIMDGNGRWATQRGNNRIFGHKSAIQAVRDTVEACAELHIPYLTLYAFSTENWNRPRLEVEALMHLLEATLKSEAETLQKNKVRLNVIGNTEELPADTRKELEKVLRATAANTHMVLTLALSYGSRADIVGAVRRMLADVQRGTLATDAVDEQTLSHYLSTSNLPDPELLIRTSGEFRLSNFMLWEIAYAEIYISSKLWPDFRREDLYSAFRDFLGRERRFGKTSEQLKEKLPTRQ